MDLGATNSKMVYLYSLIQSVPLDNSRPSDKLVEAHCHDNRRTYELEGVRWYLVIS